MALAYVVAQRRRVAKFVLFLSKNTGVQFLFGLAILPLVLMICSVFSDQALNELVQTNRILLCGAGFLSRAVLLEDRSR